MVNKIIADYLQTNKRLVVPHVRRVPPTRERAEAIAFVPFLKKDDGVLHPTARFRHTAWTPGDAQAAINEYTAEIKRT